MENRKDNFESKLDELKAIVDKLESDIPLEEGMKLFEDGLKLTRECIAELDKNKASLAELKKQLDDVLDETGGRA